MRLSPWHVELAKRVASGMPNRDIMKEIKVSGSRLSVLKANPLFAQQVSKFALMEEDKYQKAIKVFGEKSEEIAKEMVQIATSPLTPPQVRLNAGVEILDRIAQSEGVVEGRGENEEIVFEQLLRVTKKGMGMSREDSLSDSGPINSKAALLELEEDFTDEPEWEEVSSQPLQPSV